MRRQGKSVKDIARELNVSPSTASRWCADVPLTTEQIRGLEAKRRIAGAKALAPWIRKNRESKLFDIATQESKGREDLGHMTHRDLFMLGLGLYWGEGYKRGSQEWGFTNSDPQIIQSILMWLKEYYDIPLVRIIARLTINKRYESQAEHLKSLWSHETGIPLAQFGKPTFIQGYNASKLAARTYRGTLRIKVRRGTSLRRRTLASIAEVRNQIKGF